MQVRIYRASRSAMQSGRAHLERWLIQPMLPSARRPDPLMGWTSSRDTLAEIKMDFPTREAAEEFAAKQGWTALVETPQERIVRPRNYVDNFKAWLKETAQN